MSALEFESLVACRPFELLRRELKPVTVAILDTGVDATHPDLRERIVSSHEVVIAEKPMVRQTEVGNHDALGHGTAVAGILARTAANARIVDIRVLDAHNRGSIEGVLAGMAAAVEAGAKVLNMSLALSEDDELPLLRALEDIYYSNTIVVAAKKNLPIGDDGLPAELSASIGVANSDERAEGEWDFGDGRISVSALGENLVSLAAGGGYRRVSGSSFATPFVSGICCTALGVVDDLTPYEMKTLLKHWAAKTGGKGFLDTVDKITLDNIT